MIIRNKGGKNPWIGRRAVRDYPNPQFEIPKSFPSPGQSGYDVAGNAASMLGRVPLLLAVLGCHRDTVPAGDGDTAETALPAPALRRLTEAQYDRSVLDLLGDVTLPAALEPDTEEGGLLSVGAAETSVSALGVERYEDAATLLAGQVAASETLLAGVAPCSATADDTDAEEACAETFVRSFGRRAWRRPLTDAEGARLTEIVMGVTDASGSFATGVAYGLAALLQSPNFLYRVEYGMEDGEGRALNDYEIATRLSYLVWGSTPDDALLDAAEAGELSTGDGLHAQAERLLADDRAQEGAGALFNELYHLYDLDDLSKDPGVYPHASATLGPAAREETLESIGRLVADDEDLGTLMTTTTTFVNPELAALYQVRAPNLDGFGEVTLDPAGGRRGLLGQASFLLLQSHATSTSPTLRGRFIREVLLCQTIPAPPAGVNTSLPEADADAPTLRERLEAHLEDPSCASCHALMDPLGFGLEQYDGSARWRTTENGENIDPTGELDGTAFADAWELGAVVQDHPDFGPCLTAHAYAYAMGHPVGSGEAEIVTGLADTFDESGSWKDLILALVDSPAFRRAGSAL